MVADGELEQLSIAVRRPPSHALARALSVSSCSTGVEVVLGLGFYEVHNRLDNHHEALLGGLVTNESLNLALAEDKNPIRGLAQRVEDPGTH